MSETFEKGEAVIIDYSKYGLINYQKGIVVGITKAGNYKVQIGSKEKHQIFNSDGSLRGSGSIWNTIYLRKFSEERWNKYLEQEEKRTIIYNIDSTNFNNLDLEKLRMIQKIIDNK